MTIIFLQETVESLNLCFIESFIVSAYFTLVLVNTNFEQILTPYTVTSEAINKNNPRVMYVRTLNLDHQNISGRLHLFASCQKRITDQTKLFHSIYRGVWKTSQRINNAATSKDHGGRKTLEHDTRL